MNLHARIRRLAGVLLAWWLLPALHCLAGRTGQAAGAGEPAPAARARVARRARFFALLALVLWGAPVVAQSLSYIRVDGVSGWYHWDCRSPVAVVNACANGDCSQRYTGGVDVYLALERDGGPANGVGESFLPNGGVVSIPPGQGSALVELNANVPGYWRLKLLGTSQAANVIMCDGWWGSSCPMAVGHEVIQLSPAAGYTAPYGGYAHWSEVAMIQSGTCNDYFAQLATVPWEFSCEHLNPSTGYVSPDFWLYSPADGVVTRQAMNAANDRNQPCGGTNVVNVAMNGANYLWMRNWIYEDSGKLRMKVSHRGVGKKVGLDLTASFDYVYFPSHFEFANAPTGPVTAGDQFSMQLRAMAGSVVARSFGSEIGHVPPSIGFSRVYPTGAAASDGTATATLGTFVNGEAPITNASWSEVGRGNFTAQLPVMLGQPWITSYYVNTGRGTTDRGSWYYGPNPLGPFVPADLKTTVTPGCGGFTYSGQPFGLQIEAVNRSGQRTVNYDGSGALWPAYAEPLRLDAKRGSAQRGYLGPVDASTFISGVSSTTQTVSLPNPPAAPSSFQIYPYSSVINPSTGGPTVTGTTPGVGNMFQGRLAMTDAVAPATAGAAIGLQAQYWTGTAWVHSADDVCTSLTPASFGFGSKLSASGAPSSSDISVGALSFAGGSGTLTINPPSDGASVFATVAANLGTGAASNTCSGAAPSAAGADKAFLRSRQSCSPGTWGVDPSATVSFGAPMPRSTADVWITDRR